MKRPTKKPENYAQFWDDYQNNGFTTVVKKYADYEPQNYWKAKIKNFFKGN